MSVIPFSRPQPRTQPAELRIYTSGRIDVFETPDGWIVDHVTSSGSSRGAIGYFKTRGEAETCAVRSMPAGRMYRWEHGSSVEIAGGAA